MEGAPGTLYEGEKFQLLFKFSSRYPFDSPQVSTSGLDMSEWVSVCVGVNVESIYHLFVPTIVQAASLDTNKQTDLESGSVCFPG